MLYFAYGSNMDWGRMKERCRSAAFVCKAHLAKHRLGFPRCSRKWGGGVASILKDSEQHGVWGVVYHVAELDLGCLDKCEGYDPARDHSENSYCRVEVRVDRDGDVERPLTCWTYQAVPESESDIPPSQEYKRKILEGAKRWELPTHYIEKLKLIVTA